MRELLGGYFPSFYHLPVYWPEYGAPVVTTLPAAACINDRRVNQALAADGPRCE